MLLVAAVQVTEHQGGGRFENEEGVLQGVKFLLERRGCVCVLWREHKEVRQENRKHLSDWAVSFLVPSAALASSVILSKKRSEN